VAWRGGVPWPALIQWRGLGPARGGAPRHSPATWLEYIKTRHYRGGQLGVSEDSVTFGQWVSQLSGSNIIERTILINQWNIFIVLRYEWTTAAKYSPRAKRGGPSGKSDYSNNHHFWAARENGEGDRPGKVQFSQLRKLCDLDLDIGSGQGHIIIYSTCRTTSLPNHVTALPKYGYLNFVKYRRSTKFELSR